MSSALQRMHEQRVNHLFQTMNLIALFFAGAFLCNGIPHLVSGLQGQSFPTPFAKPHGVGNSPPWVNFLWGLFNAVVGAGLLVASPLVLSLNAETVALLCGALLMGVYLSRHFGRVMAARRAGTPQE